MPTKQEMFEFLMKKMETSARAASDRGDAIMRVVSTILSITHNHNQLLDADKRRALSNDYHALGALVTGFSKDILHLLADADTANKVKPNDAEAPAKLKTPVKK